MAHCVGSWLSGVSTAKVNASITLVVSVRDAFDNSLVADFRDEGTLWSRFTLVKAVRYEDAIVNVVQSDVDPNGFIALAITPSRVGQMQLEVGGEDEFIVGSPFNFTVSAGRASFGLLVSP